METRPLKEAIIYLLYHRDPKWSDEIMADMIIVLLQNRLR